MMAKICIKTLLKVSCVQHSQVPLLIDFFLLKTNDVIRYVNYYRKLVPLEAATNSSEPGSSKQSKLILKYSELVICY